MYWILQIFYLSSISTVIYPFFTSLNDIVIIIVFDTITFFQISFYFKINLINFVLYLCMLSDFPTIWSTEPETINSLRLVFYAPWNLSIFDWNFSKICYPNFLERLSIKKSKITMYIFFIYIIILKTNIIYLLIENNNNIHLNRINIT